ncbi:MAG: GNAT family N-acetyltransferase [Actinobacteria bacterium]|nr:GNAT family N-acetyltransferase [Actinomycetota bacterium]
MIRPATPDDAARLAAVAAETFPLACPPDTLPESIAAFIAANLSVDSFTGYLADPQRALFIAEVDPSSGSGTEAAGYTMVVFGEPADPDVAAAVTVRPTAELSKVYVREGFHGGGLAGQLVAASVEAARGRGAASVWLGVNQQNARANRFYEKQGFALAGTKRFLVGARYENDFVRVLPLA